MPRCENKRCRSAFAVMIHQCPSFEQDLHAFGVNGESNGLDERRLPVGIDKIGICTRLESSAYS